MDLRKLTLPNHLQLVLKCPFRPTFNVLAHRVQVCSRTLVNRLPTPLDDVNSSLPCLCSAHPKSLQVSWWHRLSIRRSRQQNRHKFEVGRVREKAFAKKPNQDENQQNNKETKTSCTSGPALPITPRSLPYQLPKAKTVSLGFLTFTRGERG